MVAVAVLSVVVAVAVPGSVQANSSSAARCDVPTLRNKVSAFVRAYNRGDLRQLDRLFSRDRFKWDSSGGAPTSLKVCGFRCPEREHLTVPGSRSRSPSCSSADLGRAAGDRLAGLADAAHARRVAMVKFAVYGLLTEE